MIKKINKKFKILIKLKLTVFKNIKKGKSFIKKIIISSISNSLLRSILLIIALLILALLMIVLLK